MWNSVYSDSRVFDWLFAQRLNPRNAGPTYVGPVVTLTSPSSVTLTYSTTVSTTFQAYATPRAE